MKSNILFAISLILLLTAFTHAQGINVPQSIAVSNDGSIYVLGNTLRPDGASEVYVLAVDGSGKLLGSAVSGSRHSLAGGISVPGGSVLLGSMEARSETDNELLVLGYDRSQLVGVNRLPMPDQYTMSAIWPNPVIDGGEAAVDISISEEGRVLIDLFEAKGNVVARIMDTQLSPGSYTARFETRTLPNGTYFCVLNANGVKKIQKVAIIR
ncbi:MAG: T9SS type A sorting domain-containing protein [Bacteroidota bacterium]